MSTQHFEDKQVVAICNTSWETGQELQLQNKQKAGNPFSLKRSVSQSLGKAIIIRIKPENDVTTRKYLMLINLIFLCISFKRTHFHFNTILTLYTKNATYLNSMKHSAKQISCFCFGNASVTKIKLSVTN